MAKCYHYTIADRLIKILISGHIKLMEESSRRADYEVCFAWLTTSPKWDKTAFYDYPENALDHQGRIRITLKNMYPSYLDYWGVIPDITELEASGRKVGVDHTNWRISPEVIPVSDFEKVEMWFWKEKKWVEIPLGQINGINATSEGNC